MRATLIIFLHELRILLKDKQGLALLFVMPLALIIFLTMALKNVYLAKIGGPVALSIITDGDCVKSESLCYSLIQEMKKLDFQLSVRGPGDTSSGDDLQLRLPRDLDGAIDKVSAGEALGAGDQIQLIFDPTLDYSLRALVRGQLSLALQAVLIEKIQGELAKRKKENPKLEIPFDEMPNVARFKGLVTESSQGGALLPNPIQQTVPAWSLFGMFFILIPLCNSMIRDRHLGVFKRLLSFPLARTPLLIGKVLPFFVVNVFQFVLMFLVGIWVLPLVTGLNLDLSVSWVGLGVVTLVAAMAATGYGLMISCLVKTSEQASAFGALSIIILAILGGVMIPRFVMPEMMQSMAMVSPFYWGLELYQDLLLRKAGLQQEWFKIGILFAFAVACFLIARLRFRWSEVNE
jgi:ABC-2 type transport system permease protein